MAAADLDHPPGVEVVVNTGAALFLGIGLGVLLYPAIAITGALIGARLHEANIARADELGIGWWG